MKASVVLFLFVILNYTVYSEGFDYIKPDKNKITTNHFLKSELIIDDNYSHFGEANFIETYGGPYFNISTETFLRDDEIIIIHAEIKSDSSGGLDYSHLNPDSLNGYKYNSRISCFNLFEESEEDIKANKYLQFLKEKSFDFNKAIFIKQYFFTNEDGTAEVILSYGKIIKSCAENDSEIKNETEKKSYKNFEYFRIINSGN